MEEHPLPGVINIPHCYLHFRQIDVSPDKANDLGDKDMLHKMRGSDIKCTDMAENYFQYHRVCMNSYLTRRVHSQEKAYPSIHTSPCDALMAQLVGIMPRLVPFLEMVPYSLLQF